MLQLWQKGSARDGICQDWQKELLYHVRRSGKGGMGGPEMNKIKFSLLWDKLNDPVFTTIRSWNSEKEDYYRNLIWKKFSVWKIRNVYSFKPEYVICHAYLLDVKVVNPNDLDKAIIEKDVLLNGSVQQDWIKRILKYDMALLLTFSKTDPGLLFEVEIRKFFEILSEHHRKEPDQCTLEEVLR